MIAVVQRVSRASVSIGCHVTASIGPGLVVLAAVHADDTSAEVAKTADKLLTLRVFPEHDKPYHRDVTQVGGGVLLVPNFTVAADTSSGRRPALHPAAPPDVARELFRLLVRLTQARHPLVAEGEFGADMHVEIHNDGPLTLLLEIRRKA